MTPEQEHYEFPPRSRLLKKLASATAERRRMQPSPSSAAAAAAAPAPANAAPPTTSTINLDHQQQHLPPPTVLPSMSPPKPDPSAIDEWFSSHQQQKDRDVIAWMDQIEQSKEIESNSRRSSARISIASRIPSSSSSASAARRYAEGQQQQQPQPHTFYNDEIIHFRSAAGKYAFTCRNILFTMLPLKAKHKSFVYYCRQALGPETIVPCGIVYGYNSTITTT